VSIVSIVLLYLALREQQKENYRLRIEAAYDRMLSALIKKYNDNIEDYERILNSIYNSVVKGDSTKENRSICEDINNKLLIWDLYITYIYIEEGIRKEGDLDELRKEHYLQNMNYSLPFAIHTIIQTHILQLYAQKDPMEAISEKTTAKEKCNKEAEINNHDITDTEKSISYNLYPNIIEIIGKLKEGKDVNSYIDKIRESRNNFLFMLCNNTNINQTQEQ